MLYYENIISLPIINRKQKNKRISSEKEKVVRQRSDRRKIRLDISRYEWYSRQAR